MAACTHYRCSKARLPPITCVRAPWLGFAVMADGTDGVGTAAEKKHQVPDIHSGSQNCHMWH